MSLNTTLSKVDDHPNNKVGFEKSYDDISQSGKRRPKNDEESK